MMMLLYKRLANVPIHACCAPYLFDFEDREECGRKLALPWWAGQLDWLCALRIDRTIGRYKHRDCDFHSGYGNLPQFFICRR